MSISNKTRKLLWGKSGNLCALCKNSLIHDATNKDTPSIVGDECHIISGRQKGPRYDINYPTKKIDEYENLILLCKVHHKLIDDQPDTYSYDVLKELKENHEKWVREKLYKVQDNKSTDTNDENLLTFLVRLNSGSEIFNVVRDVYQCSFSNDEPFTTEEMNALSSFTQTVQDYGDISNELESGRAIEVEFELTRLLHELEAIGFWVFGMKKNMKPSVGKLDNVLWPTGIIQILRSDNPSIIKFDIDEE
jgi:hypothetical protein